MSRRPRPLVVLSTVLAVAAPAAAATVLLDPTSAAASSSVSPAAPAEVDLGPVHQVAAAVTPTAVRPVARVRSVTVAHRKARPAVTRTHRRTARPVVRPAVHRTVTHAAPKAAPKPAPKPAPRPAAQPAPKPAPKPAPAPAPKPSTRGDDYPWRTATTNDPDTWGFTKRQCVSFAAHRLAQRGHALDNGTQHWGSALDWDDTARAQGVAVSSTPRVGAIAQWNAGESSRVYANGSSTPNGSFTAGGYGHVGYVAAVYGDGSVLVEQYNLGGNRSYSTMRMMAPRYLHF